jgi:cbb3-type cytochrome oxidase subunit 3
MLADITLPESTLVTIALVLLIVCLIVWLFRR